jgi:hypothetical protein
LCCFFEASETIFGHEVEVECDRGKCTDDNDAPRQREHASEGQDVLLKDETENKRQHW